MKNLIICGVALLVLVSCSNKDAELSEVERFIERLKEDQTQILETIAFGSNDISELLDYRTDKDELSNFPRNPLSSFSMQEVDLGMYVLWTIESIRMKEIDDPDFYLFASLNPRIIRISDGELVDQDLILTEVAQAYFIWWNSSIPIGEKLQINPLEGLDLNWN